MTTQQDPSDEPGPRLSQKVKSVSRDEGENQGTREGASTAATLLQGSSGENQAQRAPGLKPPLSEGGGAPIEAS